MHEFDVLKREENNWFSTKLYLFNSYTVYYFIVINSTECQNSLLIILFVIFLIYDIFYTCYLYNNIIILVIQCNKKKIYLNFKDLLWK